MKLRYYMRGLGVGIVVTAILMSVTLNGKTEKLTDAEVIERAKALGMEEKYETTVLSETDSGDEATKEESDKNEKNDDADMSENVSENAATEDAPGVKEEVSADSSMPKEEQQETQQGELQEIITDVPDSTTVVEITVHGGDGSMTVSRKLKEAGLIEDVLAYDKFLCRNGYDKKICTGTHEIPSGSSEEEIAKILTTRTH